MKPISVIKYRAEPRRALELSRLQFKRDVSNYATRETRITWFSRQRTIFNFAPNDSFAKFR